MRRVLVASGLSLIGAGAWLVTAPVPAESAKYVLMAVGGALIVAALLIQMMKDRKRT
jgi:drug/metabolite transporter superfamily protein YnfA